MTFVPHGKMTKTMQEKELGKESKGGNKVERKEDFPVSIFKGRFSPLHRRGLFESTNMPRCLPVGQFAIVSRHFSRVFPPAVCCNVVHNPPSALCPSFRLAPFLLSPVSSWSPSWSPACLRAAASPLPPAWLLSGERLPPPWPAAAHDRKERKQLKRGAQRERERRGKKAAGNREGHGGRFSKE